MGFLHIWFTSQRNSSASGQSLTHPVKCSWRRHQMETFSALLALCAGNSPVPVNSPHKGQWRVSLMFSLICARINDWVNNHEASDLRRYRGHYDVIVMLQYEARCGRSGHPLSWWQWFEFYGDLSLRWVFDGCIILYNTIVFVIMTSSNGNIFRVTGHLRGEFTGLRWIPRTKVSDAVLWCFLWSAPK